MILPIMINKTLKKTDYQTKTFFYETLQQLVTETTKIARCTVGRGENPSYKTKINDKKHTFPNFSQKRLPTG